MNTPKQFPIDLETALRHWLPKVKQPDRWRDYRAWIDHCNETDRQMAAAFKVPPPVAYSIESDRAKPLKAGDFYFLGARFMEWRKLRTSAERAKAGSKGGKKTQSKKSKRMKKRL